ncbi:MAG: riboflavin synthase [Bacteroidia bacterium]|nr:riboflavin synthase [Bacteroidia bacterium]
MFTGIIEYTGVIREIEERGSNRIFLIETPFEDTIKPDQSIAHDGVCLTVTDVLTQTPALYRVTAVQETLEKTNLGAWKLGRRINIERCLRVGDRLDGHFVQGHVDTRGQVLSIELRDGSWMFYFAFDPQFTGLLVDKGSICVNGVSLTVVKAEDDRFSVTIIPYTFEHTGFQDIRVGDWVNLEFDILGKYILKNLRAAT